MQLTFDIILGRIGGHLPLSYYRLLHEDQVVSEEAPEIGSGPLVNPNTVNKVTNMVLGVRSSMNSEDQVGQK